MPDLTPQIVPVPVRVLNETATGWLVTQSPSARHGVWLDKAAVTIPDLHEIKPHKIAMVPADLAARKRLGPEMLGARPCPSPWEGNISRRSEI